MNGETKESTTAYGLNILESIRATTDKKYAQLLYYYLHAIIYPPDTHLELRS